MPHDWQVLTPIERLFVEGSDPANQMNITIIFALSANVTRAWLDEPLERLLSHPRFRSRIVFSATDAPHFVPEPGFEVGSPRIDPHVSVEEEIDATLTFKDRNARFMDRVSEIASDHIPLSAPLWRLFLFPAFSPARPAASSQSDVSTVVVKVHHAIADGLGLLKFFLNRVLDPCESQDQRRATAISGLPRRQQKNQGNVDGGGTGANRSANGATSTAPQGFLSRMVKYLWDAVSTPVTLLLPDHASPLTDAPLSGRKLCAMLPASALPLPMLKETARALGVTINDLLYAAICATFARQLRQRGVVRTEAICARVVIPFNEHVLTGYDDGDLHNRFAFLFQPLHLGSGSNGTHAGRDEPSADTSALRRLQLCADSMQDAKTGVRPAVSLFLTRVLARLPRALKLAVWHRLTHACGQAFSNVPGPRGRVKVGDVECESAHFFVPQEGDLRVGVALLSYDGGVGVTVQADAARLENPDLFLGDLLQEVLRYARLAKMT